MNGFRLGVITDEVSQDLETALQFAKKYGLAAVELRSVWGKDPFEYEKEDVLGMKTLLDAYDMPVCSISAPFFKCSYDDKEQVKAHLAGFARCIEWAKLLGAKIIRGFDFWARPDAPVSLAERARMYERPAVLAQKAGITIALEYDPSVHSVNCKTLAELVNAIDHPNVGALYDPGNDLYSPKFEVPYPDGFSYLKDCFVHLHIKDAIYNGGDTIPTPVGKGEVDYAGLFTELKARGYDGYVVLETHYKPVGRIAKDVLRQPKGDAISFMGVEASSESMENLISILKSLPKEDEQ